MVTKSRTRLLLAFLGMVGVTVLVACGGGESSPETTTDPVAETERQAAQGLFDKLPVTWSPTKIVTDVGLGAPLSIPVTLTTTKALANAKIVFVPDLRNEVTVSPEVIPSLAAGQSATVTLTFAPKATTTQKIIAGIVLLYDKNATVSRPLPIKISLVKPVDWPSASTSSSIGVAASIPPGWNSSLVPRENLLVLRNVETPGPISEAKFANEAVFQVFRRKAQNPTSLPVATWFSERIEPGVPTPIKARASTTVSGRPAIRVVVSEMGGDRVHIYVASGTDIVEIAYGLYAPLFIAAYEAMLSSIAISDL